MTNILSNIVTGYLHAMEVQPLILVYSLASLIGTFLLILFIIQDKLEQHERNRRRIARNQMKKHSSNLAV